LQAAVVVVLPSWKRHKDEKHIFDEEGVQVFILKNCWNSFWSKICYLLNLSNGW